MITCSARMINYHWLLFAPLLYFANADWLSGTGDKCPSINTLNGNCPEKEAMNGNDDGAGGDDHHHHLCHRQQQGTRSHHSGTYLDMLVLRASSVMLQRTLLCVALAGKSGHRTAPCVVKFKSANSFKEHCSVQHCDKNAV